MPPALVLASTSTYRAELLARLGVEFEAVDPAVDEAAIAADGSHRPDELAARLARAKAEAGRRVFGGRPPFVVVGGDQVCAFGDRVLGKPGTRERAIEQLAMLQGGTHELHTAVCVLVVTDEGSVRMHEFVETTRMHMRALGREALARYVDRDRPLDCAGSYKLEAAGVSLFERVEAGDHTAIIGLPLVRLTGVLVEEGFVLP